MSISVQNHSRKKKIHQRENLKWISRLIEHHSTNLLWGFLFSEWNINWVLQRDSEPLQLHHSTSRIQVVTKFNKRHSFSTYRWEFWKRQLASLTYLGRDELLWSQGKSEREAAAFYQNNLQANSGNEKRGQHHETRTYTWTKSTLFGGTLVGTITVGLTFFVGAWFNSNRENLR